MELTNKKTDKKIFFVSRSPSGRQHFRVSPAPLALGLGGQPGQRAHDKREEVPHGGPPGPLEQEVQQCHGGPQVLGRTRSAGFHVRGKLFVTNSENFKKY